MSALEATHLGRSAAPAARRGVPQKLFTWEDVFFRAPRMAATMARYLDQLAVSATAERPLSPYDARVADVRGAHHHRRRRLPVGVGDRAPPRRGAQAVDGQPARPRWRTRDSR